MCFVPSFRTLAYSSCVAFLLCELLVYLAVRFWIILTESPAEIDSNMRSGHGSKFLMIFSALDYTSLGLNSPCRQLNLENKSQRSYNYEKERGAGMRRVRK